MNRVAFHVHSTWSYDGTWTLEQIARGFARRRYGVVLLAEHDRGFDEDRWRAYRRACAAASTDRVLLVPGIEYSDRTNAVHVTVWGSERFLGEAVETGELLRRTAAAGAVAVLAHPDRRGVGARVPDEWLDALTGVEVWNRKYDGLAPGRTAAQLLARRPGLAVLAGLDFHAPRQFFPLCLTLEGPRDLDLDGVMEALADERFSARALGLPVARVTCQPVVGILRAVEAVRRGALASLRARRRVRCAFVQHWRRS